MHPTKFRARTQYVARNFSGVQVSLVEPYQQAANAGEGDGAGVESSDFGTNDVADIYEQVDYVAIRLVVPSRRRRLAPHLSIRACCCS